MLAELWDRGGATRSLFVLLSASLSSSEATYISTESCLYTQSQLNAARGMREQEVLSADHLWILHNVKTGVQNADC